MVLSMALCACGGTESIEPVDSKAEISQENQKDITTESIQAEPENEDITNDDQNNLNSTILEETTFSLSDIEAYSGQPYVAINNNIPYFSDDDLKIQSFEHYSDLDELGRCGVAYANIGLDIMPTEDREAIGQIKPTGWHTVKYDVVDGKYLYNRCHLIGFQLAGENANEKNLITGTRYMNVDGMLPFENMVADYVKETENHVLYRVTPIFDGDNLVASGVLMEAKSVEDQGEDILFCVYVYNAQPGIIIDYATGESRLENETQELYSNSDTEEAENQESQLKSDETSSVPDFIPESETQETTYILNTNTKKFHYPYCSSVDQMKESNKQEFVGNRDDIISQGYEPCKKCNP